MAPKNNKLTFSRHTLLTSLLIFLAFIAGYYIGVQRQPQYAKIDVKKILQQERDYVALNNPAIDIIAWTVQLRAEFDEIIKPYERQYLVIFTELPISGAKDLTAAVQLQLQQKRSGKRGSE